MVDRAFETDVLIIGGGLGGLFAAMKAKESGADVIVVEKAYAGKSGGAALGGTWFTVFALFGVILPHLALI